MLSSPLLPYYFTYKNKAEPVFCLSRSKLTVAVLACLHQDSIICLGVQTDAVCPRIWCAEWSICTGVEMKMKWKWLVGCCADDRPVVPTICYVAACVKLCTLRFLVPNVSDVVSLSVCCCECLRAECVILLVLLFLFCWCFCIANQIQASYCSPCGFLPVDAYI